MERFCVKTTATDKCQIATVRLITPRSAVKSENLTICSKCGSLLDLVIEEKSSAVEMEESHAEDFVIPEESCEVGMEENPKHTSIHVTPCNRE